MSGRTGKRTICVLFTLAAAFCLLPGALAVTVDSGTTAWSGGTYEVTGDVTIDERIEVSGSVTLDLQCGTLSVPKGIHVGEGARLTIDGSSGSLSITSPDTHNAGIGGGMAVFAPGAGTITITGGTIYASANTEAAGIGGA